MTYFGIISVNDSTANTSLVDVNQVNKIIVNIVFRVIL